VIVTEWVGDKVVRGRKNRLYRVLAEADIILLKPLQVGALERPQLRSHRTSPIEVGGVVLLLSMLYYGLKGCCRRRSCCWLGEGLRLPRFSDELGGVTFLAHKDSFYIHLPYYCPTDMRSSPTHAFVQFLLECNGVL